MAMVYLGVMLVVATILVLFLKGKVKYSTVYQKILAMFNYINQVKSDIPYN